MGSFYRSQHDMTCGYAVLGKSINNFGLGGKRSEPTSEYRGSNSFGRGRENGLATHPTVKPVAMLQML
jgi:hypothetical protein